MVFYLVILQDVVLLKRKIKEAGLFNMAGDITKTEFYKMDEKVEEEINE